MADNPEISLAERLFAGAFAESELEEKLSDAGVTFERLGWDHYDCSVEIYGVPAAYRLPEEAQRVIHAAGFVKAYINHEDKWETHYDFKPREKFEPSKGWRVSYPHKRGEDERGIWVEEFIPGWPKDWFDTGYVLIKPCAVDAATTTAQT